MCCDGVLHNDMEARMKELCVTDIFGDVLCIVIMILLQDIAKTQIKIEAGLLLLQWCFTAVRPTKISTQN